LETWSKSRLFGSISNPPLPAKDSNYIFVVLLNKKTEGMTLCFDRVRDKVQSNVFWLFSAHIQWDLNPGLVLLPVSPRLAKATDYFNEP
jgi:hypothetical protein